jgi:hypothetical protein
MTVDAYLVPSRLSWLGTDVESSSPDRATDSFRFRNGHLTHFGMGIGLTPIRRSTEARRTLKTRIARPWSGQQTLDQEIEGSNPSSPANTGQELLVDISHVLEARARRGLVTKLGLHELQATTRPARRQVLVPTTRTPLTAG